MTGAVTWELLQWSVYGAIVLIIFTAGVSVGALLWLQRQFANVRDDAHERTKAVILTVHTTTGEIRKDFSQLKDEMHEGLTKLRIETYEQNAKLRERVATVETILAKLPRP